MLLLLGLRQPQRQHQKTEGARWSNIHGTEMATAKAAASKRKPESSSSSSSSDADDDKPAPTKDEDTSALKKQKTQDGAVVTANGGASNFVGGLSSQAEESDVKDFFSAFCTSAQTNSLLYRKIQRSDRKRFQSTHTDAESLGKLEWIEGLNINSQKGKTKNAAYTVVAAVAAAGAAGNATRGLASEADGVASVVAGARLIGLLLAALFVAAALAGRTAAALLEEEEEDDGARA
jgi:hypothetical protein